MKARKPVAGGGRPVALIRTAVQVGSIVLLVAGAIYLFGTQNNPTASPTNTTATAAGAATATPVPIVSAPATPVPTVLAPTTPVPPAATATLAPVAAKPSAGAYRKVELGSIGYGAEADKVGLSAPKEARPRGPSSFAVDRDGLIYVGDDVNGRVQVLSSAAKSVRSIAVGERIRDLVVGDSPDLFVLSGDGDVLPFDRTTGQSRGRWALGTTLANGLGKLRLSPGLLSLETPEQKTYPIATGAAATSGAAELKAIPASDQARQVKQGGEAVSKTYYTTSYRDGGHVVLRDSKGSVVRDVSLSLPNVLSVVFIDEDKTGSFYVQVETQGDSKVIIVELWQFDSRGTRTAVISLEPPTYAEMVRSIVVTDTGVVYQAIAGPQGMRLVKWERP